VSQQPNKLASLKGKALYVNAKLQDYMRSPYVKGLPEWQMFPDEQARQEAAKDIERGMMPRSIRGVLGFLIAVALFLGGPMVVAWLLTQWLLPTLGFSLGVWHDRLMWGMTIVGYVIVVYVAIRRDMPRALRKKLIECGVPVCLACGYDLRGLPRDRTQCPECGRQFSAPVQRLLQTTSEE
jgi:hypothetical protein